MNANSLLKPFFRMVFVTLLLLLVPAIAMQFSREVMWGPEDFLIAGVLLLMMGTVIVLSRKMNRPRLRWLVVITAVLAVALVWAELAVGLFH